jgi:DNA-binding MarR family transcriptional regulator
MEARAVLLSSLFDRKTVELLKRLLLKKDVFYLRDLARETGVSLATTYRIVQRLCSLGLVKKEHKDKFTFYYLVRDSAIFTEIHDLVIGSAPDALAIFREKLASKFTNFALYKDKDKKLFIVGDGLSQTETLEIAKAVQDQTGTKINFMVLQPQMFENMQEMGLVNKEKLGVV